MQKLKMICHTNVNFYIRKIMKRKVKMSFEALERELSMVNSNEMLSVLGDMVVILQIIQVLLE